MSTIHATAADDSANLPQSIPQTLVDFIEADGVNVFYREAGPKAAPVLLLLHGFPASSFQYRELMTLLATDFRVIAPDLPGFGFTEVPQARQYQYTFASLANTVAAFVDALALDRFALYIFDYGAPTGLRLALQHPDRVTAIITQNGNAYEEGLGEAWAPIRQYWNNPTAETRNALKAALSPEAIKEQYTAGPHPERVKPEGYTLDAALIARPGNADIQLDLFFDYRTNVQLYPEFQRYFREANPRTLAVWGRFDAFFLPAGAEAFKRDIPGAQVHLLDAGHFALETEVVAVAGLIRQFLQSQA